MAKKKRLTKKKAQEMAVARWGNRPQILQELRKYVDPQLYPHLIKWPTEHLKVLLKANSKNG